MGDVVGGLFGAAGAVAGAKIQADALKDATRAQEKAIAEQQKRLDSIDPQALAALATVQDVARRANSLLAQQQVDPALAAIRRAGAEGVLRDTLAGPGAGDQLAQTLFEEVQTADPKLQAIKQQLLDQAAAELEAGAELPPDFQAELVRTGLERSGAAGFGVTGAGVTGTQVRKLLGTEAIALQKQRQDQAVKLAGAAQDVENARVNILGSVFPKLKDLQTANLARQQAALQIGEATLPQVGLSGEDITNIELAKKNVQNQLASQKGDVAGQSALAQGKILNQLIGAGTELATSTIGALKKE